MILLKRPRGRVFPRALVFAILIATSPLFDGCSRGDSESSPAPSAQVQPSTTATASPAPPSPAAAEPPGPPPGAASAQELQELVSPIALYPDVLVAQILAASTYPPQVAEANQCLKDHPNLSGDQLAAEVNPQPWDPSVRSLTQFSPVLQTMSDNLAWTSALGEAYYNQPADVLNAIQVLRTMAMDAGTLKSTAQQEVLVQAAPQAETQGAGQPAPQQTVIIQPAQPNVVYVPSYNPATVYGAPVQSPPGYTGGELAAASLLSFGVGMLLGAAINNNNNNWNTNWHSGTVVYNRNVYVSNSNVVARPPYYGYRPPGAYPPGAYPPRPGYPAVGYPRPMPYNAAGQRPAYNGAVPATRPYDPAKTKNYAANNPSLTKPTFPSPSTLPNPATANLTGKGAAPNRPKQHLQQPVGTRPVANRPAAVGTPAAANRPVAANQPAAANRPAVNNRAPDSQRGYGGAGNAKGGRTGALGGYQEGGLAQASSARGQASLSGQNRQPSAGRGGAASPANTGKGARPGGGGRPAGGGGLPPMMHSESPSLSMRPQLARGRATARKELCRT
jgi:uncharacterized protein DUF3300